MIAAGLAAGAAIPIAAWALLQTGAARSTLRDRVIESVESSIKGELEIRTIRIEPSLAVRAEGVRLIAPDGAVAFAAESARIRLDSSSLRERRPVLVLTAIRPALDLTPADDGSTALSRALEPDVPGTGEKERSRLSLSIRLEGGSLFRGPPPGSPDSGAIRTDDIRLSAELHLHPDGMSAHLRGSGQLREPWDEPFTLRMRMDTRGGATQLDGVRVTAGGSRAAGDAIALAVAENGGVALPSGVFRVKLRAADLARWTGRTVPGDVTLDASTSAGQAVAIAHVDGGGTLSAVMSERAEGTWAGSIVARDVIAPAWGVDGVQGGLAFVASIAARPGDTAWSLHAQSSAFGFRGATLEPAIVTARGRGTGELAATVSRFGIRERTNEWRLARPATVERKAGRVVVRGVSLDGPRKQAVTLDGTWPPSPAAPMLLTTRALSLEDVPRALLPAGVSPRGSLDLTARLESPPQQGDAIPDGRISLRLRRGRSGIAAADAWLPPGDLDVIANAILGERRARVTVDAHAATGESLRATADAPLRLPRLEDHARLDARAEGLTVGRLPEVGGRVRAGLRGGRLWFLSTATAGEREILRAAGSGAADVEALTREKRLPAIALWVEHLDSAALSTAGILPGGVSGVVRGAIATGDGGAFASLVAEDARWGEWIDSAFVASVHASGNDVTATLRVATSRRVPPTGSVMARARQENGAVGLTARVQPAVERLAVDGIRSYRFALRGALQDMHLAETVATRVPEAMRAAPDADGTIDAAFSLDGGSGAEPSGWLWASVRDLVVEEQPAGRIDALAYARGSRAAATASARGPTGGRLAAFARIGPWKPGTPVLQAPLAAIAAADDFDLSSLAGFVRDHATGIAGTLQLRAVAGGTLGDPSPRAQVNLRGGSLRQREVGALREIALTATVTPGEILLDQLTLRGPRGGALVAKASARRSATPAMPLARRIRARTGPLGWALEGTARARNFTLEGERFAGSFDGNARIAGRLTRPLLVARLELDDGTIRLPDVPEKTFQSLDDHPDFVVVPASEELVAVAGRERAAVAPLLRTRLHVVAPGTLRVTGRDVDLLLTADVRVETGGARGPEFQGELHAVRGNAAVAGKTFIVEHARIGFPGAPVSNARLDIVANHVVEAAGPDGDPTTVRALVTGTVEDPRIELTSDPPMPEDAVVSLLFLGASTPRSRDGAGGERPSLAGRAATLLGNYLTQRFRDEVQKVVPVDVLELETGSPGSTAEGRLRVGKYLAPGVFLSYAHSFGAAEDEGVNSVRLEWRLRRRWQVISEITDGNRGHVDLVWTREF